MCRVEPLGRARPAASRGVPVGTLSCPSAVTSGGGSFLVGVLGPACVVLRGLDVRRFTVLSALVWLLPLAGRAQDAVRADQVPALDEAKVLMKEGLERELPTPALRGPPQWPVAPAPPAPREPGAKLEVLGERVRNEASLRARAIAEERRASPENPTAVGQARTRAAKTLGPPDKKPPRP